MAQADKTGRDTPGGQQGSRPGGYALLPNQLTCTKCGLARACSLQERRDQVGP
jgi:hypothetical protein